MGWTHEDTQDLYDLTMEQLKADLEEMSPRDKLSLIARLQAEGIESRVTRNTAKRNLKLPDPDEASFKWRAQG
jgi:hypothetical protein